MLSILVRFFLFFFLKLLYLNVCMWLIIEEILLCCVYSYTENINETLRSIQEEIRHGTFGVFLEISRIDSKRETLSNKTFILEEFHDNVDHIQLTRHGEKTIVYYEDTQPVTLIETSNGLFAEIYHGIITCKKACYMFVNSS